MSRKSIQLSIPSPCHEDWDKMTPCAQGRHCTHCSKTVIDFTAWSDTALYAFFTKKQGHVCGRFLSTQLNRPIHIPPQPHSRLYRMAIAMGLTLIFAQGTDIYAQSPVAQTVRVRSEAVVVQLRDEVVGIRGNVSDEHRIPIIGATVLVLQTGVVKGSAITDFDGNYIIKPLDSGKYELSVQYEKRTFKITDVNVALSGLAINVILGENIDSTMIIPFASLPKMQQGVRLVMPEEITTIATGAPMISNLFVPQYPNYQHLNFKTDSTTKKSAK